MTKRWTQYSVIQTNLQQLEFKQSIGFTFWYQWALQLRYLLTQATMPISAIEHRLLGWYSRTVRWRWCLVDRTGQCSAQICFKVIGLLAFMVQQQPQFNGFCLSIHPAILSTRLDRPVSGQISQSKIHSSFIGDAWTPMFHHACHQFLLFTFHGCFHRWWRFSFVANWNYSQVPN